LAFIAVPRHAPGRRAPPPWAPLTRRNSTLATSRPAWHVGL